MAAVRRRRTPESESTSPSFGVRDTKKRIHSAKRCRFVIGVGADRSTNVIVRLMGLEPTALMPEKKEELRRLASESRVSKDFINSRFLDGNNFHTKPNQSSFCANNPNNDA